jgi:hypothetical protein
VRRLVASEETAQGLSSFHELFDLTEDRIYQSLISTGMGSLFGKKKSKSGFQDIPLEPDGILRKARQCVKRGSPVLAIVQYRKYLATFEATPEVCEELAQVYESMGKAEDAKRARSRAISDDGSADSVRES